MVRNGRMKGQGRAKEGRKQQAMPTDDTVQHTAAGRLRALTQGYVSPRAAVLPRILSVLTA